MPRAHAGQPFLQDAAGEGIQGPEGLVEQHDVALEQEGAEEGHALLHAAREREGVVVGEALEAELADDDEGAPAGFGAGHPLDLQPDHRVVEHGAPREEQIALRHVRHPAEGRGHSAAVDEQAAAVVGGQESRHDVEQGALAAAARPNDGDELAVGHAQVERLEHGDASPVDLERLGDLTQGELVSHAASGRP